MMEEVDAGLVLAERFGNKYPVIVLSSIAASSDRVFDVGSLPVKAVLQKPIEPRELISKVKSVLGD
jgi:DNA-binding response OmpR family regulator